MGFSGGCFVDQSAVRAPSLPLKGMDGAFMRLPCLFFHKIPHSLSRIIFAFGAIDMSQKSPPRPRATGRVTLADVARAAEVSPITVSRALSGRRSVDPDLVERVRAAAQRLGYVPDPAARALARR